MSDILMLLGDQMDQLRPENEPTPESVSAARASATVVNSYLGTVRLGMEYGKMSGKQPDLGFLKIEGAKEVQPAK